MDNKEKIDELLKSPITRFYAYKVNRTRGGGNAKRERNEEIKELYRNGMSMAAIGRKYGVSRQCVFHIVNGRRLHHENTIQE